MKLEICANSFASAKNAELAGAHQIELCSELAVGGITPSFGLIKKVIEEVSIPIHVLIRPRSGDFSYSDAELDIMKRDIELCKDLGVSGIVSGVLHSDNTINLAATKELIQIAQPLSFTFHRAFDWVPDPKNVILSLCDLGVDRVLTSGQASSAEKGIDLLEYLQQLVGNQLIVLPGGGINISNIPLFLSRNFREVHASATRFSTSIPEPPIRLNSEQFFDETQQAVSDVERIRGMLQAVKSSF